MVQITLGYNVRNRMGETQLHFAGYSWWVQTDFENVLLCLFFRLSSTV